MSLLEDINKEEAGMSLLQELEDTPEETGEYIESEPWKPEPGEGIEGIVIDTFSFVSKFKNDNGEKPTIPGWVIKVDGDDDPWSIVGLHSVLRKEMEKAEAEKGDRVAVLYSGLREGKNDNEYHHYRVAIRRGNGSIDTPAQRKSSEPATKQQAAKEEPAKARRKPGQAKAASDDEPPY